MAVKPLIHIRLREIVSSGSRFPKQEGATPWGSTHILFHNSTWKRKTLLRSFKSANGNDLTIWARICWAYIFNILSLSKEHLNLCRNDMSISFKLMKEIIEKMVTMETMYLCNVSLFLSFQWLLNSLPFKLFGRECFRFAELVSGLNRLVFHSTVQPQSLYISKTY